jgi:beta-glucosidase
MKKSAASLLLAFAALAFPTMAQQPKYSFNDPNSSADKRIDNLLSLMTVEEKIDVLGTRTGVPRLGVPNIGSTEGIHGVVQREPRLGRQPIATTQFPQPPGMGETWDPELVREAGDVEGYESRYITENPKYDRQILMDWGPQSDLDRDPRWGRSEEVYGEDPFFNGTMAVAFAKGIEGDGKYWQASPLLKHFLANENENNRNGSSSNFDDRLFWEYYSVPFRMAFQQAGASAVMASYNAWNGTAMAVNPILRSIVRDQWGVDVLSTDGGAVTLLVNPRHAFPNHEAAVVACIKNGINQFLDKYADETKAALKDGSLTEADIDNVLRYKFRIALKLGLLDAQGQSAFAPMKDQPEPWTTDRDKDVSKKMALESVVLLKNDKNLLPLDKTKIKSIAVIGPLADSVHWDWYGGTPPYKVTPLQGIKDEVGPNVKVIYAPDDTMAGEAEAMKAASESDVAVVVVGNDPTCGPDMGHAWYSTPEEGGGITLPCTVPSDGREGRDRETMDLYQEQLIKQVMVKNPKTIVMLISSFPFTINWTEEHVPAILHMAHASQDEGTALAKVLFGEYNPGGHLVETWPRSADQLPPRMDYNIRDGYTYMYFRDQPLYPFGFGLSYTTFKFTNLKTSASSIKKAGTVTVSVDVTNTGSCAGDAVVQMYVKYPHSKVERPREELEGFKRVTVDAGQTKTVEIPLPASRLAYWNTKAGAFEMEAGPLDVMVGDSSANLPLSATLKVE